MKITGVVIVLKNGTTLRMEDSEIAYMSYLEANETEKIQDKIETMKSLEVCDPIPAYWINRRINGGGIKKVCSKCGYEVDQYITHSYNFCANCGKKMRNPEETV